MLKNCPCCGGKAYYSYFHEQYLPMLFWVQCYDCGLEKSGDSYKEAVDGWNKRVEK